MYFNCFNVWKISWPFQWKIYGKSMKMKGMKTFLLLEKIYLFGNITQISKQVK